MVWVAAGSLGALIIALLIAPAFEVRLTKRVITPVLVGAFLMVVGLILGNASAYATDHDVLMALAILSGVATGLGLFAIVVACARFAVGSAPTPPAPPSEPKP